MYRAIGNTPDVSVTTAADVDHDGMVTFDDIFAVYRAIGGAAEDDYGSGGAGRFAGRDAGHRLDGFAPDCFDGGGSNCGGGVDSAARGGNHDANCNTRN